MYPIVKIHRRSVDFHPQGYALEDPSSSELEPAMWLGPRTVEPSSRQVKLQPAYPMPTQEFDDYVLTLPDWEKDLLAGNRSTTPGLLFETLVQYTRGERVRIVAAHDGGAAGDFGSYGWVLSINNVLVWEGWGFARGYPMQSFRAEGYGRLALNCFLVRYAQFFGIELSQDAEHPLALFYTDSQSLIDRMQSHSERHVKSPFDRIVNDQDLIHQIEEVETRISPAKIHSAWVKGHQDDTKELTDLEFPALLNVFADRLATTALVDHMTRAKPAPLLALPTTTVYLGREEGDLVTSTEKSILNHRFFETELRHYLQDKFDWKDETYIAINWSAYSRAIQSLTPSLQVFVTKWCVNWIQVNRREQHTGFHDGLCPCCGSEEDYDHLLQCPSRSQWREDFLQNLRQHFDKLKTDPAIRSQIIAGLSHWVSGGSDETNPAPCYTDLSLNWAHFLRGYINQGYSARQERYYRVQEKSFRQQHPDSQEPQFQSKDGFTGIQWTARLILFLWKEIRELWKTRNTAVHGPNTLESHKERQILLRKCEALYGQIDDLRSYDRKYLDRPIEETKELPLASLRAWVKVTIPLIRLGRKDAADHAIKGVDDIRSFFRRRLPSTAPT
jgi:hypothetical protein